MDVSDYISMQSAKIEERLYDEIPKEPECVYGMLKEYISRGGKRIRPVLALACADAAGGKGEDALPYAIAIEIFHNFCMPGDSQVLTNPGEFTPISDIKSGDKVYTLDTKTGKMAKNKVKRLFANGVRAVYELRTKNRLIRATANHPFLAATKVHPFRIRFTPRGLRKVRAAAKSKGIPLYRIGKILNLPPSSKNYWTNTDYLIAEEHFESISKLLDVSLVERTHYKRVRSNVDAGTLLEWKELKQLKKGDIIIIAKGVPDEGREMELPLPPTSPMIEARDRVIIPRTMSEDLCQLCGFFLGDGCVRLKKRYSTLYLSIPPGELRTAYAKLFEKIFRKEIKGNKSDLYASSSKIGWLFDWLGLNKKATKKEVPDWVFRLPRKHKLMFLRGYLDSDGTVNKKGRTTYSSSSKKLLGQLKLLIDMLGFVTPHVKKKIVQNRFPNSIKKQSVIYELEVSNPKKVMEEIGSEWSLYRARWKKNAGREYRFAHERKCPGLRIDRSFFGLNPVLSIMRVGEEPVYDIEVENSHNFIANGILVHNTLIHDDIEDNSPLRRGKPTLHEQFGTPVAINAGDALYTVVWSSLLSRGIPPEKLEGAMGIMVKGFSSVVNGQGTELDWYRTGKVDVSEEDYFRMAGGKTASLIGISCRMGAYSADAPEEMQNSFQEFGEKVGLSFQIRDDVLNLTADPSKYKKEIGEDVKEGKRSLITLKLISTLQEAEKQKVIDILKKPEKSAEEVAEVISLAKEHGAIDYASSVSDRLVEEAKEALKAVESPEKREILSALADYMVRREK